nr:hypothetical protein [Tanacetum cinerariifolium]
MLLAMKDEAESNLNNEENDFMLDTLYGEETIEELTVAAVTGENASSKVRDPFMENNDDQIDSNIIFYDPFMENNGGTSGYKNLKHFKKAIAAQPKMYDGEKLHSVNLKIDSPDSEETLEDAKKVD